MLAYKGRGAREEADVARGAMAALGGRLLRVENAGLAGEQDGHCIIIVEKTAQTAKIYPRKYAKITKNPL